MRAKINFTDGWLLYCGIVRGTQCASRRKSAANPLQRAKYWILNEGSALGPIYKAWPRQWLPPGLPTCPLSTTCPLKYVLSTVVGQSYIFHWISKQNLELEPTPCQCSGVCFFKKGSWHVVNMGLEKGWSGVTKEKHKKNNLYKHESMSYYLKCLVPTKWVVWLKMWEGLR